VTPLKHVAAVLTAPLLAAAMATSATAATSTHATVALSAAPAPCAAGYEEIVLTNADDEYLHGEGSGNPVEIVAGGTNYCWYGGVLGDYNEIYNESGQCLNWNASLGNVYLEPCGGETYQEWEPESSSGGTTYCNEYGLNHGSAACLLAAVTIESGSTLNLSGSVNDRDVWGRG